MRYTDIEAYINDLENLKKIDVTIENDEEMNSSFYVTKTKETYVFENEEEADAKVDAARRDLGFESAKKTYKPGKINKAGEVVKNETYTVVIVLKH